MIREILKVSNLTKVYPGGVVANYNVNIAINEGEIHALIGENGAGKSTLMKMLFGMIPQTSGDIYVSGEKVNFTSSTSFRKRYRDGASAFYVGAFFKCCRKLNSRS